MKPPRIWIITADGARARFFLKEGPGLTEQEGLAEHHPRSADQGRGKPGRTFDSMPAGRHATEPHKDLHQSQEDDFLRAVAQKVMAEADGYDRILLIAEPRALGRLRQFLQPIGERLEELAKDLTRLDAKSLAEVLAEKL